ncbi:NADP-dependent malic enzyme [Dermatophagoides pteronyssinus]|uniref:Malic enzyme n=1 Tax=Dermatophagoides pteronyssinus TaxID=6956 RepID=A0ABQ8IVS4_DERPT|nr:NADP-dependent malic enzyme [Dermatophagoides pteronyssinus]
MFHFRIRQTFLMIKRFMFEKFNSYSKCQTIIDDSKRLCSRDLLREPELNKGLAFNQKERIIYKLDGLLPPAIRTQELQVKIVMEHLKHINDDLYKYLFMRDLQDYNKRLFYHALQLYTDELMPIVYTPTVGLGCEKYSLIFNRPRGMFINIDEHFGRIHQILDNWDEPDIKAIVVTDGERILGLGDLGANGMGIPVGKMALYSAIGGIPPELTLPICLDVGTNNETLLNDPYYIGLRRKREIGPKYDQFLDEFMAAVKNKWGRTCLIQFEDFGNRNAFRLLDKYKQQYCTFNDDIQGTASVIVAGLLTAFRHIDKRIDQHRFLFFGAGGAALGISNLLVMAMLKQGVNLEMACEKIWLIDSNGLVTNERNFDENNDDYHKKIFAKNIPKTNDLLEIIEICQPTCLIGAAAVKGAFTKTALKRMADLNERPIIFALSNPNSKSECTAWEAIHYTNGRCIFASGSPFDPVKYENKTIVTGQGNNVYIFPAIALAVMACQVYHVVDEIFIIAAESLAELVQEQTLTNGSVYPPLKEINEVSLQIATKITEWLFQNGHANYRPEPINKYEFLRKRIYRPSYDQLDFDEQVRQNHLAWHPKN